MIKTPLVLAACLLSALAARAEDAPAPAVQSVAVAASAASAPAMICHREMPTGSTIAVKVCRPADTDGSDARATEEARLRIQHDAAMAAQQRIHGQ